MKGAFYLGLLISLIALLGSCLNTDRPSALGMTQLNLLNRQMDLLHEEVAASQTPSGYSMLALVLSVAVPLMLGVILLCRAERSAIHSDEIIRQMARHGLSSRLIETEKLLSAQQIQPSSEPRPSLFSSHREPRTLRLIHSDESEESDP